MKPGMSGRDQINLLFDLKGDKYKDHPVLGYESLMFNRFLAGSPTVRNFYNKIERAGDAQYGNRDIYYNDTLNYINNYYK